MTTLITAYLGIGLLIALRYLFRTYQTNKRTTICGPVLSDLDFVATFGIIFLWFPVLCYEVIYILKNLIRQNIKKG